MVVKPFKQSSNIPKTYKKQLFRKHQNLTFQFFAQNHKNRFSISPDEAFKIFRPYLWDVEVKELFEYNTIYFFPIEERKK